MLGALLRLLKETGVLDSVGQLVGHRLQGDHVLIGEGGLLGRLDVENADDLAPADQGQCHLGAGVG